MSNISIQRSGGNFINDYNNFTSANRDAVNSFLGGLANSAATFVTNLWGGGFVGIKDFDELEQAIARYIENVQAAVAEYNENADISSTIKGTASEGLTQFVVATKELLKAYASQLKLWKDELVHVKEKYEEKSAEINTSVSENATEVRNNAAKISLD